MSSPRGWVLALVVLIASLGPAPAQQYSFEHYGQEQGLASSQVKTLAQDSAGHIWIGTRDGLFSYDGVRFEGFSLLQGMPDSEVRSLYATRDGEIWIGTANGVARYSAGGNKKSGGIEKIDLGSNSVTGSFAITADSTGRLYVGTGSGLYHSDAARRQFRRVDLNQAFSSQAVHAVWVDRLGTVWMGVDGGIGRLRSGKFEFFGADRGVPRGEWRSFAVRPDASMLVRAGTRLLHYTPATDGFSSLERQLPQGSSDQLLVDARGRTLIPTSKGIYGPDIRAILGRAQGLPSEDITCLLEDREGSLWIGFRNFGLVRWRGRDQWQNYETNPPLAIYNAPNGDLWAGFADGLKVRPNGTTEWRQASPSTPVVAISGAIDGSIWAGSAETGLHRVPPDGHAAASVPSIARRITNLKRDEESIWIFSLEGAFRLQLRPELKIEPALPNLVRPGEILRDFARERDGGPTWFAGNQGLIQISKSSALRHTRADGLRSQDIASVAIARDNAVWVGYVGRLGVSQLRNAGRNVQYFDQRGPLRSDEVRFVRSDSRGWIWVGTDNGADVFNGHSWRHFGTADGLAWHDLNSNAFHGDNAEGVVWLGTSRGLSRFTAQGADPFAIISPQAVITEVRFHDQLRTRNEILSIPYRERALRIRYTGLSFAHNRDLRFRYRLAGESDWVETDQREAVFPALAPGDYDFEVQTAIRGGTWNTNSARVQFEILAPWWRRGWFLSSLVLLGFLGAAALWRARTRSSREQRELLERSVAERTHELEEQRTRTEQEKLTVEDQKGEIERLLVEAQESSRLKGEFLANVSHEIRTPMNGILGMTSLALETPLTAEQRDYLETAKASGEALLALLNDILDLSKIEANRLDLESVTFSLSQCVDEALKMIGLSAQQKGLLLELHKDSDVPDALTGDPGRLRQVLLNLLSNSIKFTTKGFVRLDISLESLEAGIVTLHFTVTDTGEGIAPGQMEAIFEAFRQADGSITRRHGGSGLGLAICRRLVTLMGGRIWANSDMGHGSDFHFTARFGIAPPSGRPPTHEIRKLASVLHTGGIGRLAVLVAEDNAVNQKVLVRLLEKQGHRVDVATDGMEALRLATTRGYDLIMMDIQMPSLDGLEATRLIRDFEISTKRRRVPILMLTANAMAGDREKGLAAGADGYLAKPVGLGDLLKAVEDVVTASQGKEPPPAVEN